MTGPDTKLIHASRALQRSLHELNLQAAQGRIAQPRLLKRLANLSTDFDRCLRESQLASGPEERRQARREAARTWAAAMSPWQVLLAGPQA